jgi:hypothetical protein
MSLLALLTFTLVALLAGLVVGVALNRRSQQRRLDAQIAELFAQVETLPIYYSEADVADEPEPVRRYFARNLNEGMPHQSCARVRETGSWRTEPGKPWTRLEAEEYMVARPLGRLWYAKLRPLPGVWLDVTEWYLRGQAHVESKLLSSVTTVDASGPATRRSALLRHVASLPLFPGALLPSDEIAWEAVSAETSRVVLRDHDLEVSGLFSFDELGNIVRFETDERPYDGPGEPEQVRWVVRYAEHRDFGSAGDLQLPTKLDLEWELDGRTFHYLDMRVEAFELDVPHGWRAAVNGPNRDG